MVVVVARRLIVTEAPAMTLPVLLLRMVTVETRGQVPVIPMMAVVAALVVAGVVGAVYVPKYCQCHASGFEPPCNAQVGCVKPYLGAFAVNHTCRALPKMPTPQPRSRAIAHPWLEVPGIAARGYPYSSSMATCLA